MPFSLVISAFITIKLVFVYNKLQILLKINFITDTISYTVADFSLFLIYNRVEGRSKIFSLLFDFFTTKRLFVIVKNIDNLL
jgi:hypothetical protein